MNLRTTHVTALLEVRREVYTEIRELLERAGYEHTFMQDGSIDMTDIAIFTTPNEEGTPE